MRNRTVSELLKEPYRIVDIAAAQSIRAAAKKLHAEQVGALLVLHDDDGQRGRLAGIISERDVSGQVAGERDLDATTVGAVMTTKVVTVTLDASVGECRELMNHHRIRHLPVLDADRRPIAMVSIRDVMGSELAAHKREIEELESYIYDYR